jgi:hypothetical protein
VKCQKNSEPIIVFLDEIFGNYFYICTIKAYDVLQLRRDSSRSSPTVFLKCKIRFDTAKAMMHLINKNVYSYMWTISAFNFEKFGGVHQRSQNFWVVRTPTSPTVVAPMS